MVHKKFAGKQEVAGEMAPINGKIDYDERARTIRELYRDEVSKRMGELLLKGQTMLDQYCEACNGILMEDRAGVRQCVSCAIYEEHVGSQKEAEVKLEEEDLEEAPQLKIESVEKRNIDMYYQPVVKSWESVNAPPAVKKPAKTVKVNVPTPKPTAMAQVLQNSKSALVHQINKANTKLMENLDVSKTLECIEVIKKSSEALVKLEEALKFC